MARNRLIIDASPARVGGGVSRVRELAGTLPVLAPDLRTRLIARPSLVAAIAPRDGLAGMELQPMASDSFRYRILWQQFALGRMAEHARADWLLSPFNVLPLRRQRGRTVRRALIVSNIAPFAPEMFGRGSPYQRSRHRLLRSWTAASISRADLVFTLSGEAEERLARTLRGRRVVRLPMAPPSPETIEAMARTPVPSAVGESPYFVVVGDLLPHKGVEDAIRAVRLLGSSGREARLVVCGRAMDPRYVARLRALAGDQEGRSILFLGGIGHLRVLSLLRHSVATVVCSRIENPNRVPVEAMAVGSPIAAADVPIAREVCGDAAAYYHAGRPHELADVMFDLMDADGVAESLRARGANRIAPVDWLSATRTMLESMGLL